MANHREELLQTLIDKMISTMKSMHAGHCFSFGDLKLSRPQASILFFIDKHQDGVSAKELATFLNVTSGAITQFIDPLVEDKLVKREEDSQDRRLIRITLTKETKLKLNTFKKKYHKSVSATFDALTEPEIEQFIHLFDKLAK